MSITTINRNKWLLWANVAAFLFTIILSLQFPADIASELCVGVVVAYAIPALFSQWLMNFRSRRFAFVLLGAACVMAFGISQNLGGYISGEGSITNPNLILDAKRDFDAAVLYMQTGEWCGGVAMGYPIFISYMFKIFAVNPLYPMLFSMLCILSSISLCASISAVLIDRADKKQTAFHGAILFASIASVLFYGTVILKDATVVLGMSFVGYSFAKCIRFQFDKYMIISGIIGSLILLIFKSPMGWFVIAGVILCCCCKNVKSYKYYFIFLCLSLLVVTVGGELRSTSDATFVNNSEELNTSLFRLGNVAEYSALIPGYFSSSIIERMLYIPFTSAVQYLMPIPWHYDNHLDSGAFYWYPHITVFWYFAGGAMVGFFIFQLFRKSGYGLNRWALWFLACYCGVALASAGTVARYYLPFIPLGIPLALNFLYSTKEGVISVKGVKIYWWVYCSLLIIALTIAYWFLEIK